MRRALIIGITGQDGSYLAEHLLAEGWDVHGVVRRLSLDNHTRIRGLPVTLHGGDVLDLASLLAVIGVVRPDHVYNLAAQSSVAESFRQPLLTADVTALGAARVFEAVRIACPSARLYQASSSEMFGTAGVPPLDEASPFHPCSPYGAAKVHAHHLAVNYRESHGMFVVCGVLFNHESPRRGPEFVTRRIARGVAAIRRGHTNTLTLGNLEARRDWGWAPDYVRAMYAMLLRDTPTDYVVATGTAYAVRDFAARAFAVVGLDAAEHLRIDPDLCRPVDIPVLVGDAGRARRELGWAPTIGFDTLVERMVEAELAAPERGRSAS